LLAPYPTPSFCRKGWPHFELTTVIILISLNEGVAGGKISRRNEHHNKEVTVEDSRRQPKTDKDIGTQTPSG